MENKEYDESFWSSRYAEGNTGWDIGYVSTPIKEYVDQIQDKNIKILIPGGGNSYEAQYLYSLGFKNVWVIDLASEPIQNLKNRIPEFPDDQLIHGNFFELELEFDLIIEQTFFCALHPSLRHNYVKKCYELLRPNGKIVGLLFNIPLFNDRPPFGGHKKEYVPLFEDFFNISVMEIAYNSIHPRQGNELFIILKRKNLIRKR